MRGRSRFISDMAQMANGAATALGGLREEIDNIARQRIERHQNASGLVTREEHDALQTRHEALAARIAVLEAQLAELAGAAAKPAATNAATKKAAAKSLPRARPDPRAGRARAWISRRKISAKIYDSFVARRAAPAKPLFMHGFVN